MKRKIECNLLILSRLRSIWDAWGRIFGRPGGDSAVPRNQSVVAANPAFLPIDNITEKPTLANPSGATAKENPDALPGAIGAEFDNWLIEIDHNTRRESAARALVAAVVDLDRDDRLPFLETLIDALRPGEPLPAFGWIMAEAREWAAWASRAERKAYALASFEAMAARDQAAFLAHLDRRAAA